MINSVDINMPNNTEKIMRTFLGRNVNDIKLVILTPLQSIYFDLYKVLNCGIENSEGFFQNAIFGDKINPGILICCSQGAAAQDVVYLFSSVKILFIGYAGSLSTDFPIGSIVELSKVIDDKGDQYPLVKMNAFQPASGAYSPCFLGKAADIAHQKAREKKCSVIDMETLSCTKAASEKGNLFTAWLLITDIPGIIDVWSINDNERLEIKKGYSRISEAVKEIF